MSQGGDSLVEDEQLPCKADDGGDGGDIQDIGKL